MPSFAKIKSVNKTARNSGAVGKNAIVPRIVEKLAGVKDKILDFGSGPKAIHTQSLRAKGLNVIAHEIGENRNLEIHDQNALRRKYDVVFGSNVVNVQPDMEMFVWTIRKMQKAVRKAGILIVNLPTSPNKLGITRIRISKELRLYFSRVNVVCRNGTWVFVATRGILYLNLSSILGGDVNYIEGFDVN